MGWAIVLILLLLLNRGISGSSGILSGILQLRLATDYHGPFRPLTVSGSIRFFSSGGSVLYSQRGSESDRLAELPWIDLGKVIDGSGNSYLYPMIDSQLTKLSVRTGKLIETSRVIKSEAGDLNKYVKIIGDIVARIIAQKFGIPVPPPEGQV